MVAEVGFEPTTAALEWMGSDPLRPDQTRSSTTASTAIP